MDFGTIRGTQAARLPDSAGAFTCTFQQRGNCCGSVAQWLISISDAGDLILTLFNKDGRRVDGLT
jgi:hypothetical protein